MNYFFYLALIISTFLRFSPVIFQNMAFTMDQGRDLIDLRQIWQGDDIRMIGPTTSLNGVFLGPFYYYFISIPHLLSSGDPRAVLTWQVISFQLSVVCFWYVLKKHNAFFASLSATLLLIAPVAFYSNRYFWNANLMPTFTILFFTLLISVVLNKEKKPWSDFFLGFLSGLSMQVEAAFGVLFLPFSLLVLAVSKSGLPRYSRLITGFAITLIPQLLFELKNSFPMTKVFLAELNGQTNTLGAKLNLDEKIFNRTENFKIVFQNLSHVPVEQLSWLFILVMIVGLFIIFSKKSQKNTALKTIFWLNVGFLLFASLFYFIYGSVVKNWYVLSFSSLLIILIGAMLSLIAGTYPKTKLVVFLLVLYSFFHVFLAQKEFLDHNKPGTSNDPSSFSNQIKVIDDIYANANGLGFKVYNYIPSVYDYPFQYLFWWYGSRKFGYSPTDLAYLPNQPEYIKNKNSYLKNTKEITEDSPVFLIIQKGDNKTHLQEWLGNFAHYCETARKEYSFSQTVVILKNCQEKTNK